MLLPAELILLVAQYVRNDRLLICYLSQVDISFYQALTPLLYERVNIWSQRAFTSFCKAICTSPRNLDLFVRALRVGNPKASPQCRLWRLNRGISQALRDILTRTPHLDNITLWASKEGFDACFDLYEPVFRLRELETGCLDSKCLIDFLRNQSSIKELRLSATTPQDEFRLRSFFATDRNTLPDLESFTGPGELVSRIVAGRQVSDVTINDKDLLFGDFESVWRLDDATSANSIKSLGLSCYIPNVIDWYYENPWRPFYRTSYTRDFRKTLEGLTLYLHNSAPRSTDLHKFVVALLSYHWGQPTFLVLKRLIISLPEGESEKEDLVKSWLGNLGKFQHWKDCVPTLVSASVYGLDIS